jgi:hypothetical protein
MADLELLTLDLRTPLDYIGIESPRLATAGLGEGLDEGQEEVFLFDEEELLDFDPAEGPKIRSPLPRPRFYGIRSDRGGEPEADPAGRSYSLDRGSYAFLQWRPRDEEELALGLEWFAREAWWEKAGAEGPYIVRRVSEHSRLATQALRKLSLQPVRRLSR